MVVDLESCREMLAGWNGIRGQITKGAVRSCAICIEDANGQQHFVLLGAYKSDADGALTAALQISLAINARKNQAAA